jgi:excisionase family DNA binding protein
LAYTVDEVSDLLGVPSPTLYRYLREYSIPHLRRSGKIYVPEESFDRIKEARELHKEGLGTESVRRRLRGESNFDVERLAERLDRISETLENLQGNLRSANGTSTAQVLQTILARENLLISAVSDLSKMLEDSLPTNGRHRRAAIGDLEEKARNLPEQLEEGRPETIENDLAADDESITEPLATLTKPPTTPLGHRRFGIMARRRRRGALAILLVLLTSTALIAYSTLSNGENSETSQEESSTPTQESASPQPEETTAESSDAARSGSAVYDEDTPLRYAAGGYQDSAPEQPPYQTQDATPGPPLQEQPVLQPQPDGAISAPRPQ